MADSPSNLIAELLGDAFIKSVERSQNHTVDRLRKLWGWLGDIGEPPHGARFVTSSGSVHTGVAIIDHNRVVLLMAVRHAGSGSNKGAQHGPPFQQEYDPRQQWLDDDEWPPTPGHYPPQRHYSPV